MICNRYKESLDEYSSLLSGKGIYRIVYVILWKIDQLIYYVNCFYEKRGVGYKTYENLNSV